MNYVMVVVTHNRKKLLVEALTSLLNQTVGPSKIVLVDNNSTDGTRDFLNENKLLDDTRLDYRKVNDNIGGAGGFAYGLKIAQENYEFDWISLSDDDAIFDEKYFEIVFKTSKNHPSIQAFCGTIYLPDGRIQYTHRRRIVNTKRLTEDFVPLDEYKHDFKVDIFTFVGCVISHEIINKIGYPNKDYFIWYDDIEYSLRIRKYTEILNVVNANITHKTTVPSNDFTKQYRPDWREYYGIRNQILTQKRHTSSKIYLFFYLPYRAIKSSLEVLKPRFKGYRKHVFYVYRHAYFDGWFGRSGKNGKFLP